MADEGKLGKWGDTDLDELFEHDPDAKAELEKNLELLRRLPEADPFLLAHLAVDQSAKFGEELEAGEEISIGRILWMLSRMIFSNTLLAKRILIDHPMKLIVDPKDIH